MINFTDEELGNILKDGFSIDIENIKHRLCIMCKHKKICPKNNINDCTLRAYMEHLNDKVCNAEEHMILGTILRIIRHKLLDKSIVVESSKSNKKEGKRVAKIYNMALSSIDTLKSMMEEIMFKELPNDADTNLYYGDVGNITLMNFLNGRERENKK